MLAVGIHAWKQPAFYSPYADKIPWMLGLVMFGMGVTLSWQDFSPLFKIPRIIFLGLIAQYTVMPLAAYGIARWLHLPTELALGLILVGSCPGGTASNVMTYLARGDVAYSVMLTSCSTLLAPLLTPLLTWALCGTMVQVPILSLFISTAQIIIFPLVLGILCHYLLMRWLHHIVEIFPAISSVTIVLIVGVIIASEPADLALWLKATIWAVILHNTIGLVTGYLAGRIAGLGNGRRKALTFEVGMQNSGLAMALATLHFGGAAAIPGAVFSVWHNISASVLSGLWVRKR